MILPWCLVWCGVVAVNAGVNITSVDTVLSVCVQKMLSSITESEIFVSDVSITDGQNIVVKNLHGIERARYITKTQSWANHEIYPNIHVMNFNNFTDMKKGFDLIMEDEHWNPFSKFIIMMEHLEHWTYINQLLIFNNIYNVTILIKEVDDYAIYSFQSPLRPCNNYQRLGSIAHCSMYNGGSEIFPTITVNSLRGCRFKLAAHNIFPMLNMDNNQSEGYEQKMIRIFSKRYKFVIELVESNKIDRFERVVGNYSYAGMLDLVRAGGADGAIGGYFMDQSVLGKVSFAYPLLIDHMVRVMPRAYVYNPWLAVYHKSSSIAIFVFSLILIFSVLAYLLALFPSREKDPMRDFMIVFGYFLNKITVDKMKTGVPESLIISLLLLFAFILPYTIQAFLCSVNTHPIRGFEVRAAEEIDEGYQLILPLKWNNINNISMSSQTCHNLLDCLYSVTNSKDRKRYTMMSSITFQTYKWMLRNGRCGTELYTLREPFYSMLRTVYFRAGSVLVVPFDKFMLTYVASGLREKHIQDLILKERLKCRPVEKPEYEPLELKQVQLAFLILIGGSCLSFVCFTFELLANNRF